MISPTWNAHNILQHLTMSFPAIFILGNIVVINPTLCEGVKDTQPEKSLAKQPEQVDDTVQAGQGPGSVDRFENLALTPYWNLDMSEGETVLVDCGVYTAGESGIDVHWIKPDGTIIDNTDDRFSLKNSTKNHPQDTKRAAYTVLTLSITNLTHEDTGNYTCHAEKQSDNNTKITTQSSLNITVFNSDFLCGFESSTLCGWSDTNVENDTNTTGWQYHDGELAGMMPGTKVRHDHTYGPSKHAGHMLSVDSQRDNIRKETTVGLISPDFVQHEEEKCFEFWHLCFGDGIDEFTVSLRRPFINTLLHTMDTHQDKDWILSRVKIPPQNIGYQIFLEVKLRKDGKAKVALDDFRISAKNCNESSPTVSNPLKIRLVNGSSPREGRLEVLHDGRWGTVCSDHFGKNDSRVVCRMLGYSTENVTMKRRALFGRGNSSVNNSGEYMIWLEKLACDGKEKDLGSCLSKGEQWGDHQCTHDKDVGVICQDGPDVVTVEPTEPETKPTITAVPSTTGSTTPSPSPFTTHVTSTPSSTPKPTTVPLTTKPTKSGKTEPSTSTTTDPSQTEGAVATTGLPLSHPASSGSHTGAAVGIIVALIIIAVVSGIYCYKRKKYGHKSKYIVFSNPKYHKDNLPGNDISMDSPLTSSSLSILA